MVINSQDYLSNLIEKQFFLEQRIKLIQRELSIKYDKNLELELYSTIGFKKGIMSSMDELINISINEKTFSVNKKGKLVKNEI